MKGNSLHPHHILFFSGLLSIISVINSQECGRTVMDKIINGQEATRGTYPWMVAIVKATDPTVVRCGGTLITRRYVVTAKHCLAGSPKTKKLLMGTIDLKLSDPSVQLYSIKEFIPHKLDNDIGLVKTKLPVKLNEYVQPICLPPGNRDYSDVQAVVSGWGDAKDANGDTYKPDILMVADVSTTSTVNCNEVMARYYSPISDDLLCAGSYGGQPDHCYGDSGGPLMYYDQDSSAWQIIGVVSAAYSCHNPNDYSFYANVTYFHDWIISNSDYED